MITKITEIAMLPENTTAEILKVTPPVLITTSTFMGIVWQEWVFILTAIYTLVQILRLVPKSIACIKCFKRNWTCDKSCKLQ